MKTFFIMLAIVIASTFSATIVAADEQIPITYDKIAGKWEGNWKENHQHGPLDSGKCTVTFYKNHDGEIWMSYTGEYGRHEAKVEIRDNTIIATTKTRVHEFKLCDTGDGRLILKDSYTRREPARRVHMITVTLWR